jgi:hypothetical protein
MVKGLVMPGLRFSFFRHAAAAVVCFAALGAVAEASVLKWTLNGPINQSADPITGSFLFDTATSTFSDIALVSPATSPSGGLTFDTFFGQASDALIFGQSSADPNGAQTALSLSNFSLSDLSAPGILKVNDVDSQSFAEFSCDSRSLCEVRTGSSVSNWKGNGVGTLTGEVAPDAAVVPVPAALPLVVSAVAMLGLIGRRRRATA